MDCFCLGMVKPWFYLNHSVIRYCLFRLVAMCSLGFVGIILCISATLFSVVVTSTGISLKVG